MRGGSIRGDEGLKRRGTREGGEYKNGLLERPTEKMKRVVVVTRTTEAN